MDEYGKGYALGGDDADSHMLHHNTDLNCVTKMHTSCHEIFCTVVNAGGQLESLRHETFEKLNATTY